MPDRGPQIEALDEQSRHNKSGDDQLDDDRACRDREQQAADLAEPHRLRLRHRAAARSCRVRVARRHQLPAQSDAPGHDEAQDARHRQHADAADLHGEDDDDVAEGRPVARHVDRGEARHADGRDGGEHGVGQRGAPGAAARARDGQGQEQGGDKDKSGEDENGEPGRRDRSCLGERRPRTGEEVHAVVTTVADDAVARRHRCSSPADGPRSMVLPAAAD